MYLLVIIPLPEGGLDYTVLDSAEEEVLAQDTIPADKLALATVQKLFPALSTEDHARILEKMRSLNADSDPEELQIPEY